MNEYPLYPELSEDAQKEAVKLIESFKENLKKAAEEAIGNLYVDVMPYIESDTWSNFRGQVVDGFRNYNNSKIQAKYDFKQIRQKIYEEYRDEIIEDLNKDLVEENKNLKETIARMEKDRRNMMRY